jgi:hypothetical protein
MIYPAAPAAATGQTATSSGSASTIAETRQGR